MIRRIPAPTAAINSFLDNMGRVHFRPTPMTSAWAQEFGDIQARFVKRAINPPDPLARLAIALITLEAIVTPDDHVRALQACTRPYRYGGTACIEWKDADGRLDRRFLSSISTLCLPRERTDPISREKALEAIRIAASAAFPTAPDPTALLYLRSSAWAMEALPGALAAHVLRLAPMTPLHGTAWARRQTLLALAAPRSEQANPQLATEVVGDALEAFHCAPLERGSSWYIVELEAACTFQAALSRSANKASMLKDCQKLLQRLGEADSASSLLLGWAADLVESGTPGEPNISPKTVHKYVRAAGKAVHAELGGQDFLNWTSEEFLHAYQRMISSAPAGSAKTLASALSSVHAFLCRWLDTPPLHKRLHQEVPDGMPRAEVIWPHEINRIKCWLDVAARDFIASPEDGATEAKMDERLLGQLKVAVRLEEAGRFRAMELFHLRLHNFRFYDQDKALEVEIAPMRRDATLKTPSAKRVLEIHDPEAVATIRAWHLRRQDEGALSSDFLFGDPHYPERVYRLGRLYTALNLLTREATGSRHASLHSWGHAWASQAVAQALDTERSIDVEPLDDIATKLGQLSAATTLKHYAHIFEEGLRAHVDRLLKRVALTSAQISGWTGIKATTIRQRAFSRKLASRDLAWELLDEQASAVKVEGVEKGLMLAKPGSPLVGALQDRANVELVVLALGDIASGLDLQMVARRCRRSLQWIHELCRAANSILLRIGYRQLLAKEGSLGLYRGLVDALNAPRLGLDFSRVRQEKFRDARAQLAALGGEASSAFVAAWERCYRGRYLSLTNPESAEELFRALAALGVPQHCLAISIACSPEGPLASEELVRESRLQLAFRSAFACDALLEYKRPRRGRPHDYLIWSTVPLEEAKNPTSAAISLTGFNALMFSMAVYLQLHKEGAN